MKEGLGKNRIGTIGRNKFGSLMEIVEYKNARNILVRFLDNGNVVHTSWRHFDEKAVRNPYDKSICGIGYIGEGKHNVSIKSKLTLKYITWRSMIVRCYDENYHKRQNTYIDCSVCKDWLNFQNFAEWYDQNYYEVEGQRMELDKDILYKGNKIYSPETSVFVPKAINNLFTKREKHRGDSPIGVHWNSFHGKYAAQCCGGNAKKTIHLGYFDNPQKAFVVYKITKENLIKKIANKYKLDIPTKLYNALINYEVEISD